MKHYALIACYDKKTEDTFKELWKYLYDNEISDYGFSKSNMRPHITIADYYDIDEIEIVTDLKKYYSEVPSISISFNQVATFIGSTTIYFAPTMSEELIDFHKNYHQNFAKFNSDECKYYLPGVWVPHNTIASRLTNENINLIFDYCRENYNVIEAIIQSISLIEVIANDEGVIVESKHICEIELESKKF